jgi:hypothetical protein
MGWVLFRWVQLLIGLGIEKNGVGIGFAFGLGPLLRAIGALWDPFSFLVPLYLWLRHALV